MSGTALEIALVAIGGAIGATTRYGVEHLGFFDDNPYYYTVVINISGCLIIGILSALFQHYGVARIWTVFAMGGCLGGYTTYSAFTLDAITQWSAGRVDVTLFYIAITVIGGLGACAIGLFATERILRAVAG